MNLDADRTVASVSVKGSPRARLELQSRAGLDACGHWSLDVTLGGGLWSRAVPEQGCGCRSMPSLPATGARRALCMPHSVPVLSASSKVGTTWTEAHTEEWSCPRTCRQRVPRLSASRAARLTHHRSGGGQTSTGRPKAHALSPSHFLSAGGTVIQCLSVLPKALKARWLPSPGSSIHVCLFCAQTTAAGSRAASFALSRGHAPPPMSDGTPLRAVPEKPGFPPPPPCPSQRCS